jgi:hypothetical protein
MPEPNMASRKLMTRTPAGFRRIVLVLVAAALVLASAFFIFYTARLLVVTRGLRATRAGGGGAYVGAVGFPLLALLFGWGGWRIVRALRGNGGGMKA